MKNTLKSTGAVVSGLVALTILSLATDTVLQKAGAMKTEPFAENPVWLIMAIIIYRTVFIAAGAYLAARLAPARPMKHAVILGIICTALSIAGLIMMWDIPPRWYPVSLILLTMPAVWLGGRMAIKK